jgi:2-polyprenyl-3-methyl-5-hydroxy-6-metoxy-1,4-benzoquinol methylase
MPRVHEKYKDSPYFEDQRHFFDELVTNDWDKYDSERWNRTRQIEILRILSICRRSLGKTPISILDVGCGCGYHDMILGDQSNVTKVVGVDYSEQSVKQASAHYPHPKVERLTMDIFSPDAVTRLLKAYGPFDLVTTFQVIEHLTSPAEFLAACASCAQQDGYIAVVTPNRLRAQNFVRSLLGKKLISMDFLHYKEYSLKEIINLGADTKLEPAGWFGHTFNLYKWRFGISSVGLGTLLPRWADFIGVVFKKQQLDHLEP